MYFYVINYPIKLPNLHVIVYILNEANDNFSINKKKPTVVLHVPVPMNYIV